MASLVQLSDDLWTGVTSTHDPKHHPFAALNHIEEITGDVAFYKNFSNLTVVNTGEEAVLIDTGSFHPTAYQRSFDKVRSWNTDRIHSAIYTHGHADHAYGLPPFLAEAEDQGWAQPEIIGHSCCRHRMDRYIETEGYNSVINERQFGFPIQWPTDPIYPTTEYEKSLTLNIGGKTFQLHHGKGETDDHTWVFVEEDKVLYTGDLFIWASPNAGNPQKVQRYVHEWSVALRAMAALHPEVLMPGHGVPVFGADRVQEVLIDTAEYLESLYSDTVAMLNQGQTIYDIIHTIKPPAHLAEKPYLQPIYDEPEFVVRTVYRCLAGWYTGIPSELKPAPRSEQARELIELTGGVEPILARAEMLLDEDNFRMACHWADWAVEAAPMNAEAHRIRAAIYEARSTAETSTMAKGVYNATVNESKSKSDESN
jgi:glyoxylase-like metal-dependent hydrolase (beta-lactamase superfamily II)